MKVVEKDILVHGMLEEELDRCRSMVISMEESLSGLPRGTLQVRTKKYKDKAYSYHYLKYREGARSVSRHVPEDEVDALRGKLDARRRIENEISSYRARISYLEKILSVGKG